MTQHAIPPEDAFDRWLDDLADGSRPRGDDRNAETAMVLQDHFGLPPAADVRLGARDRERILRRVMTPPTPQPARRRSTGATGVVAGSVTAFPVDRHGRGWRVASVASVGAAAVLVLLVAATLGALLRMGDDERAPGVAATASLMPFAPRPALASPTPMPCATDDTLLLTPEEPAAPGAFAALPFPVAWYGDGMLTVEQAGEMIRSIDIGTAEYLSPTPWPDVVIAYSPHSTAEETFTMATLVNLASGDVLDMGRVHAPTWTGGPFVLWASDEELYYWHMLDLRTFERISLNDRFDVTPARGWFPGVELGNASNDGTVLLVSSSVAPYSGPVERASPAASERPELVFMRDALLIDGSLDDIFVVGPLAISSGAMTLSPNGELMAWLAPSDRAAERILTIAETSTGDVIHTQPVEPTYNNSLLFSADGGTLYGTVGQELVEWSIMPDSATPVAGGAVPIELTASTYEIAAATTDRTKLLLSRSGYSAPETSTWLDLDTGEMREYQGTVGRLWESTYPVTVARGTGRLVLLDDLTTTVRLLDMETGEVVAELDREDGGAGVVTSMDGSAVIVPREGIIDAIDLASGTTATFLAPESAAALPRSVAIASDGDCAAVTWTLEPDGEETVLLSMGGERQVPLPPATVGGWVPASLPDPHP